MVNILKKENTKRKSHDEYSVITSTYVPNNDSEKIAILIENFRYCPNNTKQILEKYKKISEITESTKKLKRTI